MLCSRFAGKRGFNNFWSNIQPFGSTSLSHRGSSVGDQVFHNVCE